MFFIVSLAPDVSQILFQNLMSGMMDIGKEFGDNPGPVPCLASPASRHPAKFQVLLYMFICWGTRLPSDLIHETSH